MRAAILGAGILLGACGGGGGGYDSGGGGSGGALPTYSVGGMVSGLQGGKTLVLRNNNSSAGSDDLTISSNGPFTFASPLAYGTNSYSIIVATQPMGQVCTVANGSGTNVGSNITNVQVTCT